MNSPENPFKKDWESFRFPVRPVRIFSDGGEAVGEGEEGTEDGKGGSESGGAPVLEMGWQYVSHLAEIHHMGRRKKIRLCDLDSGLKIIRLLAAIEARPELDVDGLIDALEFASWDCHGQSLGSTLEAHAKTGQISWTPSPQVTVSGPSNNFQTP